MSPKDVFSSSDCICNIYPLPWSLPGIKLTSNEEENIRVTYKISEDKFIELITVVEELIDNQKMGWPYVFYEPDEAKKFYQRFLSHIDDIKLFGIALEEQYVTQFLHEEKVFSQTSGFYKKLSQLDLTKLGGKEVGYDILGFEIATFHSFICNSLEEAYKELGITVNEDGLLLDYDQAVKAANYTMRDDVGAEPVTWFPWKVTEYSLRG